MDQSREVPVVYGGPESLFRIDRLRVDGQTARGSATTGPWLTGPDERVAAGSIAVLIDDVLGYATVAPQPPELWSVSTDITLDVFPSLQDPTTRFHAEAEAVYVDAWGCFATGRVVNDEGALVALCSQRGRYVPLSWSAVDVVPDFGEPARQAPDVMSLIGAEVSAEVSAEVNAGPLLGVENSVAHQNVLGNLHGGISLCASDSVATMALNALGQPRLATSSLRIAYSRPVPGGATIHYRAEVRHRGRTFGIVDVVGSVDGRPCTMAQVTAQPAS